MNQNKNQPDLDNSHKPRTIPPLHSQELMDDLAKEKVPIAPPAASSKDVAPQRDDPQLPPRPDATTVATFELSPKKEPSDLDPLSLKQPWHGPLIVSLLTIIAGAAIILAGLGKEIVETSIRLISTSSMSGANPQDMFFRALMIGALLVPVALIGKSRIRGLLLPYAMSVGILFATSLLLYKSDSRSSDLPIRDFLFPVPDSSNLTIFFAATALALVLSNLTFFLTNYGTRYSKLIANVFFRTSAIWLILFFGVPADFIFNKAERKMEQAAYQSATYYYEKRNLHPEVQVYSHTVPAGYRLEHTSLDGSGPEYTGYFTDYVNEEYDLPIIRVSNTLVSEMPSECENTMLPRIQAKPGSSVHFTCNIVLKTKGGQDVYGYRSLSASQHDTSEPPALSAAQIRQIQPSAFYMHKDSNFITITYPTYNNRTGLTPAMVEEFADGLKQVSPDTRQAFVQAYIKGRAPGKPIAGSFTNTTAMDLAVSLVKAIYAAALWWAVERIFTKANRGYWKAYIPFINFWHFYKIAGLAGSWSLLFLLLYLMNIMPTMLLLLYAMAIPFIAMAFNAIIIGLLASYVWATIKISCRFGKSWLYALMLLIPPFPGYFILGFGKDEYRDS